MKATSLSCRTQRCRKREEILAAIPRFVGAIEQRPPAYLVLKIAGQPAYKLARRGEQPDLLPRRVEIHSIELVRYEYPELELLVRCGSGTYIRSLGRDLAESIGTGAVMSQLRRLAIGPFAVENALAADDLSEGELEARLLSPLLAVDHLPRIALTEAEIVRIAQGQSIATTADEPASEIAAVDCDNQLVAILASAGHGRLRPTKCFIGQSTTRP